MQKDAEVSNPRGAKKICQKKTAEPQGVVLDGISDRGGLSRQTVHRTVWSYGQITKAIFSLFQIPLPIRCKNTPTKSRGVFTCV